MINNNYNNKYVFTRSLNSCIGMNRDTYYERSCERSPFKALENKLTRSLVITSGRIQKITSQSPPSRDFSKDFINLPLTERTINFLNFSTDKFQKHSDISKTQNLTLNPGNAFDTKNKNSNLQNQNCYRYNIYNNNKNNLEEEAQQNDIINNLRNSIADKNILSQSICSSYRNKYVSKTKKALDNIPAEDKLKSASQAKRGSYLEKIEGNSLLFNSLDKSLVDYFKEMIDLENEIEAAKQDLIHKGDFNFDDAFFIFELSGRGYISQTDIKYGLNSLGIYPSEEEIYLLVKRYDSTGEEML